MRDSLWRPLPVRIAGCCVVLIMMFPGESRAADWKERLLAEAPAKWASLEQYYAKMEVSFRETFPERPKGTQPGQYPDIVYRDIRKNGELMVYTGRRIAKNADGKRSDQLSALGVNSRYAFELAKTMPNADAYLLANFEQASGTIRGQVHNIGHSFSIVFEVCGWDSVPLSKLIKDPQATIRDVHGTQRGGREMAQLNYERPVVIGNQPSSIERGAVVLDPEHYWCVREYQSELPKTKSDGFVEYGDDVDGFPILRRSQHTVTYKDGTGTITVIKEFDKLIHRDIPESEFTLSAFGMPELQLPGENPNTLWRWLIGIGILFGVVAIFFRMYVKKRQVKQPA